jgi:hypothetical protein
MERGASKLRTTEDRVKAAYAQMNASDRPINRLDTLELVLFFKKVNGTAINYVDGSYYNGQLEGMLRNGKGTLTLEDGETVFTGLWKNGRRQGFGTLKCKEYEISGDWEDDNPNGFTRITWFDGAKFEGLMKEGRLFKG